MRAIVHAPGPALGSCELTFVARKSLDVERAAAQHRDYCALLADCGVAVESVGVSPQGADAVFVEDTAVVLDECAVLCAMGVASRRDEPAAIAPVLRRHRPVHSVLPPAKLEGGDVLRVGRTLYVGRSARTDESGIAALAAIVEPLGYRVVPVDVRDCLHLKTACTAAQDDVLLANPAWVDVRPFTGMRVVEVDPAEPFGANLLRLDGVLLASASFPRTNERLRALGHTVRTVAIDELEKAEAGMTCLSLLLRG